MSQKRPPIQDLVPPNRAFDNMTIHHSELSYLFKHRCLGCKCEQPTAIFKWDKHRQILKRICNHHHELSLPNKCGNKITFNICILCGIVTEKEEQLQNHMQAHKYVIDASKFCHFCKANKECKDGFLEHIAQHLRISNFLDIEITNPNPTQLNKTLLDHHDGSCVCHSSSSNASPILDNSSKNINNSEENANDKLQTEFLENSQKIMAAINDPSEAKFKEFLKKMPEAAKIVLKPPPPAPNVPLSQNDNERIANYFNPEYSHAFEELPEFKSSDPFLPGEEEVFHWIKEQKVTKRAFEQLNKILPHSMNLPPKSSREQVLVLNDWKRVQEITDKLVLPEPWTVEQKCPIFSVSDYIRRLAEKRTFWEHLIVDEKSVENLENTTSQETSLLKQFVNCYKFKLIREYCEKQDAIPLLLALYLDDMDLVRFEKTKSYCGYYTHVSNLCSPLISEVQDTFLVALSKRKVPHNLILETIFKEFNFLFDGIIVKNSLNNQSIKMIPVLWLLLGDSPERCGVTCTLSFQAEQGCLHCNLDLRDINKLINPTLGEKKTIEQYLVTRLKCMKLAKDLDKGKGCHNSITKTQTETGFRIYDTNQREADITQRNKDIEKGNVYPLKTYESYLCSNPLTKLTQTRLKLFDLDQIVIVPFHTLCQGVNKVIFPWLFELCDAKTLKVFRQKRNLPKKTTRLDQESSRRILECNIRFLFYDKRERNEKSCPFFPRHSVGSTLLQKNCAL